MRAIRQVVAVSLGVLLALSMVGEAGAATGDKIKIDPRTVVREYHKPYHHLQGWVGIKNRSRRSIVVKCQVVVLLKGPGTTHKRGYDSFRAKIKRGHEKRPSFAVKIKDAHHKFNNTETSTAAHCHRR